MTELTSIQTDQAISKSIHDMGSAFMLHGETMARAGENGYENPFAFYFAGRGGVLGEVDADVIYAAFGWFAPGIVRPMWEAGVAVHGAKEAARRYFAAAADWGRDHLAGCEGLDRFNVLAARLVGEADCSGRSLFAGWRVEPRVEDAPGLALQLIHVMREWRGSNHLVATTAAGLTPVEAILAGDGEGQAKFFGWAEPFAPVGDDHRARRQEAEALTDRLCAASYEVLSPAERGELAELVPILEAAANS
ncbi:MAG: SCO6745 family protein [Acidimicrobiales bacterium]